MRSDRWEVVSARFLEALELADDARAVFLADLGRVDASLAKEVEGLLAAHATAGTFLDRPLGGRGSLAALAKAPVREYSAGTRVGGFEIVKPLGRGAFATVYLARELALGRLIALKVSPVRGNEARTMASLEHDHIVRVFSERVDPDAGVRLICMQYVAGASLRKIFTAVREGAATVLTGSDLLAGVDALCVDPPPYDPALARERHVFEGYTLPEAVARLGARLARALEHAHRAGVLHLDVKPDNILVSPYGRPFLADFNVALTREPREDGEMLGGTFAYMAPEHRRAYELGTTAAFCQVTPAADIYSLGIVLFELLTGKHPQEADGAVVDATAATPEALALRELIETCLAPDAEARYPNADTLAARLDGFLGLAALKRALPAPGPLTRVTQGSLLFGLVAFTTGPQALGSLVNIAYNASRIVSELSPAQRDVFASLLWTLNPIFYGTGIAVLSAYVWPLHRHFRAARRGYRPLPDAARAALRRRALRLPTVVATVTTACWGVSYLAFPWGIHLLGGPLPGAVFLHFGVSFFLAWIVALTYSFLYVQHAVVRVIYPELLLGDENSRATAARELAGVGRKLSIFQALAGLIPSLAATLLLASEALVPSRHHLEAYRWLLISLIASGIVGFLVALRMSAVLGRAIYALTDGD